MLHRNLEAAKIRCNDTVRYLIVFVGVLLLAACGGPAVQKTSHRVHYSWLQSSHPRLPKKVVLLPVSIPVLRVRRGPIIDQLESRSKRVSALISRRLFETVRRGGQFKLVKLPGLSRQDKKIVKNHLVLYDLVSRNAVNYTTGRRQVAWHPKLLHFDYSIGNGLRFLIKKTGARAALIVTGAEALIEPGISRIRSKTFLIIGLVDLSSGALLWMNYVLDSKKPLNHYGEISYLIDDLLRSYPGISSYRTAVKK